MVRLPLILTLAGIAVSACALDGPSSDPDKARIITTDLANFWKAYDEGKRAGDLKEALQKGYLDCGSKGVKQFIPGRIQSAEALANTVRACSAYYESTRAQMLKISGLEKRIRVPFHVLKSLYPDAVFPDVFFVVGRLSSGGTSQPAGLLIGAEFYSGTPKSPHNELSPWVQANIADFDRIPAIVSHELIHYQQKTAPTRTLLDHCIIEGSADFIGELISGGIINQRAYAWAEPKQAMLWKEFKAEMDKGDLSHWLYQGDKAKDRPADLGYYMGYKICQAYYQKSADKKKAIKEILTIKDFSTFLKSSGYDPR